MQVQLVKGLNRKKYKVYKQSRLNLGLNPILGFKLKKKNWFFLRFNNKLKLYTSYRLLKKRRFFFKNMLRVRRILRNQTCLITSKSLKRIFRKAQKGRPRYLNFLNRLESRLDVCLYRSNFFKSPGQVRQVVNHGFVYVNGVLVNKPGYILRENDIVQYNYLCSKFSLNSVQRKNKSCHLEIDPVTFSFIYLGYFTKENIPLQDNTSLYFLNYIFKC